eukprot:c28017_g1_i1 orf=39-2042(+)
MGNRCRLLEEDADGDDSSRQPQLTINRAYAQRFAHNKQREALQRLQEMEKRGFAGSSDEDESSDDEEDEDGVLPARTDAKIFETLSRIRRKDPSIYSQSVQIFDGAQEADDDGGGRTEEREKKKKPVYLKDALAKQLIEDGPCLEEWPSTEKITLSYAQEQQALKNAFLESVANVGNDEGDEEEDGFVKITKNNKEWLGREKGDEGEVITEGEQRSMDSDVRQRLEEYFGRDDNLDEEEKFLKTYLRNQSWIDRDHDRIPSYDDIVGNVSEEEEELDRQDRFEAEYNFRFQEGACSQVMGHSRLVDGSVRRKNEMRKKKRQKKAERLSQEALERREELKRLKNIKKNEILKKLEKIRSVAGMESSSRSSPAGTLAALGEDDLEDDFDPEEYDEKMREVFGDAYYGEKDADAKFQGYDMDSLVKPDFDAEDESLDLPKGWDEPPKFGFSEAREKARRFQSQDSEGNYNSEEDKLDYEMADDEVSEKKLKRKKKGKISFREKLAFDKQLGEYYKLDYEDMIGNLPTRFKYRQIKQNTYGLSTFDILLADDKDLNEYISLKKLATFRTEEWKPNKHHHLSQKMRKKLALNLSSKKSEKAKTSCSVSSHSSNPSDKDKMLKSNGSDALQFNNGEIKATKKRKKCRRGGPVISQSRLIAYGKISIPKKKRKV